MELSMLNALARANVTNISRKDVVDWLESAY